MQGFLTVAISVGFLFSTSFVLISCLSCRRFIAKRKLKKQKKREERVNIPEIKIDLGEDPQEKHENGIANPAYAEIEVPNEENGNTKESSPEKVEVGKTVEQSLTNDNEIASNNKEEQKVIEAEKENAQEEQQQDAVSDVVITSADESETDFRPSETESAIKSDDEVFPKIVSEDKQTNKKAEPTKIYDEKLTEEELQAYNDVVFQGEWRRPVALKHLLETGLINKEIADEAAAEAKAAKEKIQTENYDEEIPQKLRKFLCGEEPIAGILVADSGEKKSIFKSAKDGILRRGTAISLLEAQAATGNIIDPVTGRKMSVKEAAQLGLLDKVYETVLLRAERAVTGYKFRASDHVLSLYEAMQKGLVVESHGLRLLEAQCATGGVIDHRINIRVPLDVAVQRGLLDERLKEKLEDDEGDETKTFFDPNTEKNVTYKELMKRSVMDPDTGLRLYHLEKIAKKRVSYGSYSGRSSQASSRTVSRSNSRENIPAALSSSP